MNITDEQRFAWGAEVRERLRFFKKLHPIVEERIARQERLDASLREALQRAESNDTIVALSKLTDAIQDAARRGRLIAVKLESAYLEGRIREDAYHAVVAAAFPAGTTAWGDTAVTRINTLVTVANALEQHRADVDSDGALHALAREGADQLASSMKGVQADSESRHQAHSTMVKVARDEWDEGYFATKEIVAGVLRDAGRRGELLNIFPDVMAHRKSLPPGLD